MILNADDSELLCADKNLKYLKNKKKTKLKMNFAKLNTG